jgi:SAM-dependent MidA family methyltransferase
MTTKLQHQILERIRREGPITFAEYMRMALYEPGLGYYVADVARMGWQGDYFTSADVSDLFAHCMGRQLQHMWEQLRQPAPFIVVEQGAGRGNLAQGVQTWARQAAPALFEALDYRIADMRTGQDALAPGSTLMAQGEHPSVLLSNELVDAFPVHIVELSQGRLREVYVAEVEGQGGQLCEILDTPGKAEIEAYLDRFRIPWRGFAEGWRAEINLDALRWMEHCAHMLRRGYLLTIDYGEKARALYTRNRQRGTLLCYYRHQASERPLARPGEQDITAHVNFSALIEEGRRHGLHLQQYETQRSWLEGLGLQDELEQRYAQEFAPALANRGSDQGQIALLRWRSLRQGASVLTNPAGMGNFKVLVMAKARVALTLDA